MKRPKEGARYLASIRYCPLNDMWTVRITDTLEYRGPRMCKVRKEFWSKAQAFKFMQEFV